MYFNDSLVCIYNYMNLEFRNQNNDQNNLNGFSYYLIYSFDESGFLDKDIINKLYIEQFQESPNIVNNCIGPFSNLEEMGHYAITLCEKLNASSVYLLSTSDYNSIIEQATNSQDLLSGINKHASLLQNIDKLNRKKGIWGKIFD